MKIDMDICTECLKRHLVDDRACFRFTGYVMFFDGEKSHFSAQFVSDMRNLGKKLECEIEVDGGEGLARRMFRENSFRRLFKKPVPHEFNSEIEEHGTMCKKCFMYDQYLLKSINGE